MLRRYDPNHLILLLGEAYRNGRGVPEDYKEAAKWFTKAAEQGDADAQYNLGIMYDNGRGVPKDDKEAVKWYRKSAEQGYADAQYNLGVAYSYGRGVTEDDKEGVKWFRKAAAQGDAQAQYNLGVMYSKGDGVPESYVQTYAWFNIAAANGHEGAKKGKTTVAELMTKEQIAKAQDLSREMIEANPKLMGAMCSLKVISRADRVTTHPSDKVMNLSVCR